MIEQFTYIDLFSGIGGFRIPLTQLGGYCVGFSEINKEAIKVYQQNFNTQNETAFGDITQLDTIPTVDIVTGGVPCQPWSIAGKRKGFEDPRGQLWHNTIELIRKSKPKGFVFENVKGLLTVEHKEAFNFILNLLTEIGYTVKVRVLRAFDFGLPQDRQRVFIVGVRDDLPYHNRYFFRRESDANPIRLSYIINELENYDPMTPLIFRGIFTFSDLREGLTTIHSWDIVDTTERQKKICLTILRNRRKKAYGNKDGNPLSFDYIKGLIPDISVSELDNLLEMKILRQYDDGKFEFFNCRNLSGIGGVFKIILPNAYHVPTITATENKNYFALKTIDGSKDDEDFKRKFLDEIYLPGNFVPFTANHLKKLQGFPEWFIPHEKERVAKAQFGNAVPIPVVYHTLQPLVNLINQAA